MKNKTVIKVISPAENNTSGEDITVIYTSKNLKNIKPKKGK